MSNLTALKVAAIVGASLLATGTTSYIYLERRFRKQIEIYEADLETEAQINQELLAALMELQERKSKSGEQSEETPESILEEAFEKERTAVVGLPNDQKKVKPKSKKEFVDYSKIRTVADVRESLGIVTPEDPAVAVVDNRRPFLISVDDYYNDNRFVKSSLTYFDQDETLSDDSDEIISSVDEVIGEGTLDRFGELSGDPDMVYVRNSHIGVDYEITRVMDSYKISVAGMIDD